MEFKNSKSISQQIADRICDEIILAKFKENERVPSVREYASYLEVNVNTVVKSYDYLASDGILRKERGLGYFVENGACITIRQIRKKSFVEGFLPELFSQMNLLGISIDEVVDCYHKFDNKIDGEKL